MKLLKLFPTCFLYFVTTISPAPSSPVTLAPVSSFTGNLSSSCNSTWVLDQIKEYLEREDFSETVIHQLNYDWINPQIFWDNVVKIQNICTSKESVLLRKYCWIDKDLPMEDKYYGSRVLKDRTNMRLYPIPNRNGGYWFWMSLAKWSDLGIALGRFPLKSGKFAMHYCELVDALPPQEDDFNYNHIERILRELTTQSGDEDSIIPAPNFGSPIQERLKNVWSGCGLWPHDLTGFLGFMPNGCQAKIAA